MDSSMEKILQMGSLEEYQGNTINPFEKWLAMKPNGLNYEDNLSSPQNELLDYQEMSINGSNSISNVSVLLGRFERQTNKFLHLASPLIFFAFLAIAVTLIILFERKSRRLQLTKDAESNTDNECMEMVESHNGAQLLTNSEPVLNKVTRDQSFPEIAITSVSERNGLNVFETKIANVV